MCVVLKVQRSSCWEKRRHKWIAVCLECYRSSTGMGLVTQQKRLLKVIIEIHK